MTEWTCSGMHIKKGGRQNMAVEIKQRKSGSLLHEEIWRLSLVTEVVGTVTRTPMQSRARRPISSTRIGPSWRWECEQKEESWVGVLGLKTQDKNGFLFERAHAREWACVGGEGQREKEWDNLKWAPRPAWSHILGGRGKGLISWEWDQDLTWNQELNAWLTTRCPQNGFIKRMRR